MSLSEALAKLRAKGPQFPWDDNHNQRECHLNKV